MPLSVTPIACTKCGDSITTAQHNEAWSILLKANLTREAIREHSPVCPDCARAIPKE